MTAANTDKWRKSKSTFSTTLSGSINDTDATIGLSSVSGLPTDTAITITIDRVDSNGTSTPSKVERVIGVISGSNLTNCVRANDGTTAQSHASGAVVECIWDADSWNDATDSFLVGHDQAGTHKSGSVLTLPQINDTSSDHQYVVAVNELAADRTVTLPLLTGNDEFVFKDHAVTMTNKTLTSPVINTGKFGTSLNDSGGNELMKVTATSSAVNEVTLANAATNTNPTFTASGDDDNVGIDFKPKGTGTVRKPTSVIIQVEQGATSLTTGDGKAYFTVPVELNGMNLVAVHARVITAGTTNTTDIQIANVTDAVDMLSTKLTIDTGETGSDTAATAAVIDGTKDDVATNDLLRIDIDAVSTTAPKGLIVRLRFALP